MYSTFRTSSIIQISTGTIVDATIIHAPSSTKNANKERDPEMHQTRKGNQWYFGLKAHIGVESRQGVVHSVCMSAASVADCHMLPACSTERSEKYGATAAMHPSVTRLVAAGSPARPTCTIG
jgi:IS5 family transposase